MVRYKFSVFLRNWKKKSMACSMISVFYNCIKTLSVFNNFYQCLPVDSSLTNQLLVSCD